MCNRELLKRDLRGAVFSYLDGADEGEGIFMLLQDLKAILDEEEDELQHGIDKVKHLRHFLFSSTIISENNEAKGPASA